MRQQVREWQVIIDAARSPNGRNRTRESATRCQPDKPKKAWGQHSNAPSDHHYFNLCWRIKIDPNCNDTGRQWRLPTRHTVWRLSFDWCINQIHLSPYALQVQCLEQSIVAWFANSHLNWHNSKYELFNDRAISMQIVRAIIHCLFALSVVAQCDSLFCTWPKWLGECHSRLKKSFETTRLVLSILVSASCQFAFAYFYFPSKLWIEPEFWAISSLPKSFYKQAILWHIF